MPIQWFPGHMHATRKALAERLPDIDVVIELLDARLPGSSANPLLAELTHGKPALKVLNKQDLADPERTALWLAHYQAQPGTNALGLDAGEAAPARRLVEACRALAPLRGGMVKPLRVLICGIPNVGKSTLINTLVGQRKAKTGDEAGITKNEQRITLASDVYLFDTPGMLWPRISVEESGYLLAASGAVGRNAYDEQEVALVLLGLVRGHYAERLQARYKLGDIAAMRDEELLAEIAQRRGGRRAGGGLDLHKGAEVVINDFRVGAWGRITVETPDDFARWSAAGEAREAERTAKKEARGRKKVPQRTELAEARMNAITIYHNPRCSNSRGALELIRAAGIEPEVIDYLANPPDRATLLRLIRAIGQPVRALMREKEAVFTELGLADPALSDDALIDAVLAHPVLLNRPIVVSPRGTRLCRPPELVKELLPG